jgi:predicted O-methyltransferase YrrM
MASIKRLLRKMVGQNDHSSHPAPPEPRQLTFAEAVAIVRGLEDPHELAALNNPLSYVELLASCLHRQKHGIRQVKGSSSLDSTESKRFATLLRVLENGVPPLSLAMARPIARHADSLRFNYSRHEFWRWAGDIGIHFEASSSFADKGRLLAAVVRILRPRNCLELGTAYGMSGHFILSQLEALGEGGHLTTVEFAEQQYQLSRAALEARYGDLVTCQRLDIATELPGIAESLQPLHFVFHDANHTGDAYVKDFHTLEQYLASGSVLIVDDIDWKNAAVPDSVGTYKGWLTLVEHKRVRQAVEVDDRLGLLQMA